MLLMLGTEFCQTLINEEDYMGIDYSKLVPMLIKSIQELNARIELLESQIQK